MGGGGRRLRGRRGIFAGSYAIVGAVKTVVPVDFSHPRLPAATDRLFKRLLALLEPKPAA
jgi:Ni,Fe-hydrogenase III small subunit